MHQFGFRGEWSEERSVSTSMASECQYPDVQTNPLGPLIRMCGTAHWTRKTNKLREMLDAMSDACTQSSTDRGNMRFSRGSVQKFDTFACQEIREASPQVDK